LDVGEDEIVSETCRYIKSKRHCIPCEMFDKVVVGSYLNIVEYIDEDEQESLLEMIGMAERAKGVLQMYKEEMKEEMKEEVKEEMKEEMKEEVKEEVKEEMKEEVKDEYNIEMAKKLKDVLSPEEIAKVTGLTLKTVLLL
jgi:polyribonucleotide nucleotidyltransferase